MPRTRTGTRRIGRTAKSHPTGLPPMAAKPLLLPDPPPRRGVKLKHVSSFTMGVAVLCLLAFLAGRVDISAATAEPRAITKVPVASIGQQSGGESKEHSMVLGLRTVKYDVPDIAKAKEWYSKAFGVLPYFDEPAYYVGYNIGGYELGLTPAPTVATKREAAGVAYWGVEDIRAEYKRLTDLGATSVSDVQEVGGGILVAEVADPFGNVIGLIYNPHFVPGQAK
jgi:predicted enzyme related to lactoylglutathione lyase